MINQLAGFSAGAGGGIKAAFTNEYSISFGGTASATATVPAVDLKLGASPTKQILVFVGSKAVQVTNITINGVRAGFIITGDKLLTAASAIYAGSGPFNIVVTMTAVSSEVGGILVYEVDAAAPLYEATRGVGLAQGSGNLRQLANSLLLSAAYFGTDTQAFTWTGPTENFDADVGDYRLSSAADFSTVAARTARAVSTNPPTTGSIHSLGVLPVGFTGQVRGGFLGYSAVTGSASTFTFTNVLNTNLNDIGNPELVIAFTTEANVTLTGVTFNGVAMTSRGSVVNTGPAPDLIVHFFSISLTNGAASGNVVATASASVAGIICVAGFWTLYGVGSYGTLVSGQGNPGTGGTLSPVNNDGGVALFACITANSTGITVTGADTIADIGVGTFESQFSNIINDAAATQSITSSFSSQAFAQAALPVNP
jgi:hypothetical protein